MWEWGGLGQGQLLQGRRYEIHVKCRRKMTVEMIYNAYQCQGDLTVFVIILKWNVSLHERQRELLFHLWFKVSPVKSNWGTDKQSEGSKHALHLRIHHPVIWDGRVVARTSLGVLNLCDMLHVLLGGWNTGPNQSLLVDDFSEVPRQFRSLSTDSSNVSQKSTSVLRNSVWYHLFLKNKPHLST